MGWRRPGILFYPLLNSKTYVLTSTDYTNAVWVTDPIFGGGSYACVDRSITLPGSTTGFWDLWASDEIAILTDMVIHFQRIQENL